MGNFRYADERFADLQMLRYRLNGFEQLTSQQKTLIFYLSKAALFGRDITFDQYGRYNLLIRKTLEAIYTDLGIQHDTEDFKALELYLKRVWFSNGIYHHYGCEKFTPDFSERYFRQALRSVDARRLPLASGQTVDELANVLCPVIFDATHSVQQPSSQAGITGGNREMVPYLMRAALAVGIDGLFIETHPDPDKAISDAANQVRLSDMENLLKQALEINSITR